MHIFSGQETFAAVQSMAEDMIEFYKLDQNQAEQEQEQTTVVEGGENIVTTSENPPKFV